MQSEPTVQADPAEIPAALSEAIPTSENLIPTGEKPVKRSRKSLVAIILLVVALLTTMGFLAFYLFELAAAQVRIDDQDRELEEQRTLIEKKETFGAAMQELMDTARKFDGVPMSTIVPFSDYESLAAQAWGHRWRPVALELDIDAVRTATSELEQILAAAEAEASTNATGTKYEEVIDLLGRGFASSLIDESADSVCGSDVLACVAWDNPYLVLFDAADMSLPYMSDWLKTGLAYHEFAHVLQATNPEPTGIAVDAFGGDLETMADCFALTYLDGWTLNHRVWVGQYTYWDASIGYGYTCDESQRQVVREWHESLGFAMRTISQ